MTIMYRNNSVRTLKVSIIKENWSDVREILQTTRGRESTQKLHHDSSHNRLAKLTALHLACRHGAPLDIVRAILAICPQLATVKSDHAGDVPLHYAVHRLANNPSVNSGETVAHLLRVSPESVSMQSGRDGAFGNAVNPLHVAVLSNLSPGWIELLSKASPSSKNKRDGGGRTAHGIASLQHLYRNREEERRQILKALEPDDDSSWLHRIQQVFLFLALYALLSRSISIVRALLAGMDRSHVYHLLLLSETAGVFYFIEVKRLRLSDLYWAFKDALDSVKNLIKASRKAVTGHGETVPAGLTAAGLGLCIVCWEKPLSHVLLPCGHLCLCADCASPRCRRDLPRCPVDKCPIESAVKVYIAGVPK